MPVFLYKAIDKFGKEIAADVEAANYDEAIKKVRSSGYFPTQVTAKKEKKAGSGAKGIPSSKKGLEIDLRIPFLGIGVVKSKEVTAFTRQLSTLISAGLPLVRSLNILREQSRHIALKEVLGALSQQVEAGGTFSDALLKHPKIFSKLYVNTVKAGEAGGVLEIVLSRLADFNEKSERLRSRIRAALVYPFLVIGVALLVLVFLMIFVIPKFMELFEELGTELPLPTLILMKISDFLHNGWVIGIVFIIILYIFYRFLKRFYAFNVFEDTVKLHLPVFGVLAQKVAIARFSRTLGTLISSGVPILQALTITKDTAGNEVVARSLTAVHDSIREGESIAGPLAKTRVFPLMVVNMINVGEETGSLDQMLNRIADTYDEEVNVTVNALTSLLEPLLILFMGIVVGSIVISMFLPLVKLLTSLSA